MAGVVMRLSHDSRRQGAPCLSLSLHLLLLGATDNAIGGTIGPSRSAFSWRNDSANLALTARWNDLLTATPWSLDITSPDVVDTPPIALEWTLGTDMPMAQKDGVGCWLTDIDEFVIAGGLWAPTNGSAKVATPDATDHDRGPHLNLAYAYNTKADTWQELPGPPWMPGRGTGACTPTALYLVSGVVATTPNNGTEVAKLSRKAGKWVWEHLPPLPQDGYRWLGSSGVINDYLYAAVGLSTRPVANGGTGETSYTNTTYRLRLSTALGNTSGAWERVADFPSSKAPPGIEGGLFASGGLDGPNDAVVNGSLYIIGGGTESWGEGAQAKAFAALYGMGLPVPIVLDGTAGLRTTYKYDAGADTWSQLPDVPLHVERGGSVALKDRYIISLGSTHDRDSFRVGSNCVEPLCGPPNPCKNGMCGKTCNKPCHASKSPPDMSLGGGILTFYGDDVLAFDTGARLRTSKHTSRIALTALKTHTVD